MKGTVEYADKAAYPRSRLKHYFNDLIILCIYNGMELICAGLIKQLQLATVTGHLLHVKPHSGTCRECRRLSAAGGKKRRSQTSGLMCTLLTVMFKILKGRSRLTRHLLNTCRNGVCSHLSTLRASISFLLPATLQSPRCAKCIISLHGWQGQGWGRGETDSVNYPTSPLL